VNKDIKEYYCSKHGGNGEPTCNECWRNLMELLSDKNCLGISEHGDLINE